MEPRTISLLYDLIEREYQWRILELSNFKSSLISETNEKVRNGKLRAGIALLYAHWEGFIKQVSGFYYEFVSFQSLKICELNNSFISILFKNELNVLSGSNKLKLHQNVVRIMMEDQGNIALFAKKNPIRTANLNYDVFEDVCVLLGIEVTEFEDRYKRTFDRNIELTINEDLVGRRNKIAHGEYLSVNTDEYKKLYDVVVKGFLFNFKEIVMDCASKKSYLR